MMIYMWDKREIPATVSGVVDPESDPDPTKVISAYLEIILKKRLIINQKEEPTNYLLSSPTVLPTTVQNFQAKK